MTKNISYSNNFLDKRSSTWQRSEGSFENIVVQATRTNNVAINKAKSVLEP